MSSIEERVFIAATNNAGKLAEIKKAFGSIGYTALSLEEAGVVSEPEENGKTFLQNAVIKASAVGEQTGRAVVADDSGLLVEALGGLPGIHTARYAKEGCTDSDNIDKLLRELEGLPAQDRRAWFAAAVVLLLPGGEMVSAHGYTAGRIGFEPRGALGFGYDPVFYVRGGLSFSELSEERKNAVSHRGRAIRKLCFKLKGIGRMKGYE